MPDTRGADEATRAPSVVMMPIPAELRLLPHWAGWRHQRRDGRMTKIPYVLGENGRKARANDPTTWRGFDAAEAFGPQYDGIGFELGVDDPFSAIDLDLCLDKRTGAVAPWAREIVRRFDSYTEVTPSGEGLRIFCTGQLPRHYDEDAKAWISDTWINKRLGEPRADGKTAGCELYSFGKYLTVTGDHLPGTPETVNDAQAALDWLIANPPSLKDAPSLVAHTVTEERLTDSQLVKKASAAANGDRFARLWAGDTSAHGGDDSRADMALCSHLAYWTDGDRSRMDSLFRQSGLYRPKWDERHGAAGQTYGEITIASVLADFSKARRIERQGGPAATPAATVAAGGIHKLSDLMDEDLPEPAHAVPGLIQRGLMILAGKPKIGKSWLVLNILLAVAAGGMALGGIACAEGDVLYLALEDPKRRLQARARKQLAGAKVPRRFEYATEWPRLDQGGLEQLDAWLVAHPEAALVCIDVWKRIKPPPAKGSNAYDSDYDAIIQLQRLAIKHDVAILVVHHLNKNPSEDDTDVISGSIGFTGGADGHIVMKLAGKSNAIFRGRARDVEPFDLALAWDNALATWAVIGDADEVALSAERREVIRVLEEAGRPMKPHEVAPLLGKLPNAVKKMMFEMGRDGQLEHRDGGYYFPPNRGNRSNPSNPSNRSNRGNRPPGEATPVTRLPSGEGASNRPEGLLPDREGTPVTAVTAVTGVAYIRCRKCDAPLTAQRQAYGYCAACSQGALYEDEERF